MVMVIPSSPEGLPSRLTCGAVRVSGIVGLNFTGEASFSCHREACEGVRAAIAQQLPSSEEVEVYRGGGELKESGGISHSPWDEYEEKTWCSYLITFNSTTAMEASDILDFLRSKDHFSQHLGNVNFSSGWRPRCAVEVPMVSEPFKSFIAATTGQWRHGCHQVVEVTIGVEHTFQMRCYAFDEMARGRGPFPLQMIHDTAKSNVATGRGYDWNPLTSEHGVLVKESAWNLLNGSAGPLIRLVALESSLGNRTDGWLNVTQNISSDLESYTREKYCGPHILGGPQSQIPSFSCWPWEFPVHLSIRIKRQGAATGTWSPEPIETVPCLVERTEFELVMNFTPSPGESSSLFAWSRTSGRLALEYLAGFYTAAYDNSISGGRFQGKVLWSRPLAPDSWPSSDFEMTLEELEAWQSRMNFGTRYRPDHYDGDQVIRSIRSVQVSNSSASLSLMLWPPAGGSTTTWRFCFYPADGTHVYSWVCTEKFPVRVSQSECDCEFSAQPGTECSIGQQLKMIVWLQCLLLLVNLK
eukprot:Skav210875  [mRNA]  locus=scaffold1173:288996:291524:- [translate_table: standard]